MKKITTKIFLIILVCTIHIIANAQTEPQPGFGDLDKDGVLDKDDLCPGVFGSIANKGCPDKNEGKNLTTDTAELFNTRALEMKDLIDAKKGEFYYESLQKLTENWGVITAYNDHTFRPNLPLTRIQFIVFLNRSLDRLNELLNDASGTNEYFPFFSPYKAQPNLKEETLSLKDITTNFSYFQELQSMEERYNILIGDDDMYFRPNKEMTELEFYSAFEKIFSVEYNTKFSSTKIFTRGEFAVVLNKILDFKVKEHQNLINELTIDKIKLIKEIPTIGKAKIIDEKLNMSDEKEYYGNSVERCTDFTNKSTDFQKAVKNGGVINDTDRAIFNDDVVDIIYEFTGKCKNEKLVMVRKGTIINIFYEGGIKRIK